MIYCASCRVEGERADFRQLIHRVEGRAKTVTLYLHKRCGKYAFTLQKRINRDNMSSDENPPSRP